MQPISREDIKKSSHLVLSQDEKFKSILLREQMLREQLFPDATQLQYYEQNNAKIVMI
jgi:hypothetical protein